MPFEQVHKCVQDGLNGLTNTPKDFEYLENRELTTILRTLIITGALTLSITGDKAISLNITLLVGFMTGVGAVIHKILETSLQKSK